MISIENITTSTSYYQDMRNLRNKVLLRPLGIPDYAWEMYDEKSWLFVALDQATVIGCAILVPSEENKTSAQIIQMAVDTNYQKKGIGKQILDEVITFAKKSNIKEITCHSRQYAVPFYEKLGFRKYGKNFIEVGIPHNYMKLNLL